MSLGAALLVEVLVDMAALMLVLAVVSLVHRIGHLEVSVVGLVSMVVTVVVQGNLAVDMVVLVVA